MKIWGVLELGSDSCRQTFRHLDPFSWNKNRAQYSSVHEENTSKTIYFHNLFSHLFSLGVWAPQPRVGRVGGICYQAHSNCSRLFPSLRTPSVMSKQAFAVRQGERELGCLWQMETIRVSLFHVSCGRNFSMLLPNRSKRCQRQGRSQDFFRGTHNLPNSVGNNCHPPPPPNAP